MPVIKSAKKKLRQDKKRTADNTTYKRTYKKAVSVAKKATKAASSVLKKAYSAIDKATKKKIIHKNKAARLKSQVAKKLTAKKK